MPSIVIGANENFDVEPYLNERARQARQALLENEFAWNQQLGAAHLGLQQQQLGLEAQRQQQAYGLQQQEFGENQNRYQQALQQHLADQSFQQQMEENRARQTMAARNTQFGYETARDALRYGPGGYEQQLAAAKDKLLYGPPVSEGYLPAARKAAEEFRTSEREAAEEFRTSEREAGATTAEQKMVTQARLKDMANSTDPRVVEAYLQGETTYPPPPPEPDVEGYNTDPYTPRVEAVTRAKHNEALQQAKTTKGGRDDQKLAMDIYKTAYNKPAESLETQISTAKQLRAAGFLDDESERDLIMRHPVPIMANRILYEAESNFDSKLPFGYSPTLNRLRKAITPLTDAELAAMSQKDLTPMEKIKANYVTYQRNELRDMFGGGKVLPSDVQAIIEKIDRAIVGEYNTRLAQQKAALGAKNAAITTGFESPWMQGIRATPTPILRARLNALGQFAENPNLVPVP